MNPIKEIRQVLGKWIAKTLGGPKTLVNNITAATLSLIQYCAKLFQMGVVKDIHRIKESMIERSEAETEIVKAKAAKDMADAAEAANHLNLSKRNDIIAKYEKERLQLENAKTRAEIKAIETRAETDREKAMVEAKARFIEAINSLQREGGNIYFRKENLGEFLDIDSLPEND